MYKNTGQPGLEPTFKIPGKGCRLCNPFRTTRFFFTQTRMGRTQTRLTRPICHVYISSNFDVKFLSYFLRKKIIISNFSYGKGKS